MIPKMIIGRYGCGGGDFFDFKGFLLKKMNSIAKIIKGIVAATSLVNIPRMANPAEQVNNSFL